MNRIHRAKFVLLPENFLHRQVSKNKPTVAFWCTVKKSYVLRDVVENIGVGGQGSKAFLLRQFLSILHNSNT